MRIEPPFALFVLSTGRCGTQWLAQHLGQACGAFATVTHEPLHEAYHSRQMLGAGDPRRLGPEIAAPILAHLDSVGRCLQKQPYIECGYPCWSSIPWFAEQLGGRLRILHLTRHPVSTAMSWLTHGVYQAPLAAHLKERVLLSPFDDGVELIEYREQWARMSPFEKCLYWWTELHRFGLAQEQRLGLPWLRLRFEDLISGAAIAPLGNFLGMPVDKALEQARTQVVDQHRFVTLERPPPGVMRRHPRVVEMARALGYEADDPAIWSKVPV